MGIDIKSLKSAQQGSGAPGGPAFQSYPSAPPSGPYGGQQQPAGPYGSNSQSFPMKNGTAPTAPPYAASQPPSYGTPGTNGKSSYGPAPSSYAPSAPMPPQDFRNQSFGASVGPYGGPPGQPSYRNEPTNYGPSTPAGNPPAGYPPAGYPAGYPGQAPAPYGAPNAPAKNPDEPKVLQLDNNDRQYAIRTYLPGREYWIATDESASMNTRDCKLGNRPVSRWEALGERASQIAATAEKFDSNGLTWIRFGNDAIMKDNVKANEIMATFYSTIPSGATNMIKMLRLFRDTVLRNWQSGNRKPHSILIFTDGEPTPEQYGQNAQNACSDVIKELANGLRAMGGNDMDVAISFVQLGYDENSSKFLNYLDDKLKDELAGFDIVDTKHWDVVLNYKLTDEELILDGILD